MKVPIGVVVGLAQQGLDLLHRVLPHERVVYRVEDRKGKTVGVFTNPRKAELLGDPIEDLLNPRIHSTWAVHVNPLGNETRGRFHSRTPFEDGVTVTGLHSEGEPVEIVATSRVSLSVAEALAREAYPLFMEHLARYLPAGTLFAYGRLNDGREGCGVLWEEADRVRVFRNAWCSVSDQGFPAAEEAYRRMTQRNWL